jgi:hypothetical protein
VAWTLVAMCADGARDCVEAWRRAGVLPALYRVVLCALAIAYVMASSVPLKSLNASKIVLPSAFHDLYAPAHALIGTYGLFRSMTGVGPQGQVAVPWLQIEVQNHGQWRPLSFKHYPSTVHSPLTWAAPHQPRLDWQMWFAALAPDARYAKWLDAFTDRLFEQSPDVWALTGERGDGGIASPLQALRARVVDADLALPGANQTWIVLPHGHKAFIQNKTGARTRSKPPRPCTSRLCAGLALLAPGHHLVPAAAVGVALGCRALLASGRWMLSRRRRAPGPGKQKRA